MLPFEPELSCADFEVRFCCPKYSAGSDCSEPDYDWTSWKNSDSPDETGDWEIVESYGEADVCSNPVGVEARKVIKNALFLSRSLAERRLGAI